ncbi:MAG: efflux RND transporter permease subunit [candidate division KSB1 bacterium]|nr:efflux RND transporter permease subunit [candidate division KSB1 bacterium]MDZ7345288.1 efflux RND transporter permease subunit [candidate division KSB1 bacterium]
MKITEISINRWVGTVLAVFAVVIMGLISLSNLPVAFWPEFTAPSLIVVAPYPGASPEDIEETIVEPLEEQLSTIDGVEELESICFEGACRVIVRFGWGVDFKEAKRDVQEKTARARSRFPRGALEPTVLQVQDFIPPGIEIGFYSDKRSLEEVREFLETKVKNRILRLENVAAVQIVGGFERQVRVAVDPQKLNLYGLTMPQINAALASANLDLAAGKNEIGAKNYYLRIKGKFESLEDIRNEVIKTAEEAPIRLRDIASVEWAQKEQTSISRLNGREIVGLSVREKSGGNTVAMVDEVLKELAAVQKILPPDIKVSIIREQAGFIKQSIKNVVSNAAIGAVLAGIIIFIFLGSIRNTLVIALSIPISIIGTFLLIDQFGLTINTISLGGLALGVGMIVDASIVVLENIYRRLQQERTVDRKKEIVAATAEVGSAITSSTLTSIVVFLPMVFLVGLFSVLLGELALTVVFSLSLSIIVALTVVPMLSDKFLIIRHKKHGAGERIGFWQVLLYRYELLLRAALRRPILVILAAFLLTAGVVAAILPRLDVQMLPSTNEGEFRIDVTMQEGTRLAVTDATVKEIEAYLSNQPEVESVYAIVGLTAGVSDPKTNVANLSVRLKPDEAKKIAEVMDRTRQAWRGLAGAKIVIKQVTATEGMQREPVNVRIVGDDLNVLRQTAQEAMNRIRSIPGLVNLTSTLEENLPEFHLRIRRDRAAELGISSSAVSSLIAQAFQRNEVTRFSPGSKEYEINVQIAEDQLTEIEELLELPVPSVNGQVYPLRAVVDMELSRSAGEIHRFDQQRVVIITADVSGASEQAVRRQVRERLKSLPLPPDYYLAYGGQSKGIADSFRSLLIALVTAVFLVYVVMGAQFNSFSQPLIIAMTIPPALIGVFGGLWIFGASLSMNALLGMIMLVGIVVNNGILLVDFINQSRARGVEKIDAVVEAGVTRVRPILMTALTTIFGMLPIALGLGKGGETLQPLGAVVAGGLFTSTFLTLLVVPSIYMLLTKGPKRLKR